MEISQTNTNVRKQGIGHALAQGFMRECRARGFKGVVLYSHAWTAGFWAKEGFFLTGKTKGPLFEMFQNIAAEAKK
jgi:predicted N-acetyltransferase YhbS